MCIRPLDERRERSTRVAALVADVCPLFRCVEGGRGERKKIYYTPNKSFDSLKGKDWQLTAERKSLECLPPLGHKKFISPSESSSTLKRASSATSVKLPSPLSSHGRFPVSSSKGDVLFAEIATKIHVLTFYELIRTMAASVLSRKLALDVVLAALMPAEDGEYADLTSLHLKDGDQQEE